MDSSEHYTIGYGAGAANMADRSAEREASFFLPRLNALGPISRVIDCGCGPGSITIGIAKQVPSGRVVGIDIGANHIEMANSVATAEAVRNVTFLVGSVYEIPYADGSFDAAFSNGVIEHLSDPIAAIKEMRRVTREGGLVAIRASDVGTFVWSPTNDILDHTIPILAAVMTANEASPYAARNLRGLMREAGLKEVMASSSTQSRGTPQETLVHGQLWSERFKEADFMNRAVKLGVADPSTLEQLSRAWEEWGNHTDAHWAQIYFEAVGKK